MDFYWLYLKYNFLLNKWRTSFQYPISTGCYWILLVVIEFHSVKLLNPFQSVLTMNIRLYIIDYFPLTSNPFLCHRISFNLNLFYTADWIISSLNLTEKLNSWWKQQNVNEAHLIQLNDFPFLYFPCNLIEIQLSKCKIYLFTLQHDSIKVHSAQLHSTKYFKLYALQWSYILSSYSIQWNSAPISLSKAAKGRPRRPLAPFTL